MSKTKCMNLNKKTFEFLIKAQRKCAPSLTPERTTNVFQLNLVWLYWLIALVVLVVAVELVVLVNYSALVVLVIAVVLVGFGYTGCRSCIG
jgi:hypothetical protein